ncbi:MAG: HlyD family type I secretion periplasmic adaptor subunit [Actinomycetota bacterium]
MSNRRPIRLRVVLADRQRDLLTEPALFEEERMPRFVRMVLGSIAVLVAAFVLWASLVHIDEVAIAPGQIVPSSSVKVIQHLEGGVVGEVLVSEGQSVSEGQVLARIDEAQVKAELDQLRAREAGLALRAERLKAVLDQREPDFAAFEKEYPGLVADQRKIWANQLATQDSAISVIDAQLEQRRTEIGQMESMLSVARAQADLARRQYVSRQAGAAEGVVSEQMLLESQRARVTAEGEAQRLDKQLALARDSYEETAKRRANAHLTQRQDALGEQGSVAAEIEQVRNAVARLADRHQRLDIRSPVTGIVQDLRVRTSGEVVAPGGTLMRIVPADDVLEAEVRIVSAEVGHLQPGQRARLKVSSYDYTRYGFLEGRLERISPTTFVDEANRAYYKGVIAIPTPWFGPDKGQNPVLPGMAVEADIVTGAKSLAAYLLKPITVSVREAFQER